jgi:hypothetical protein
MIPNLNLTVKIPDKDSDPELEAFFAQVDATEIKLDRFRKL